MDSEEKVHLKSERRGSSKFPNFIEHASKQKLSKLQIKKENKKLERLEEIRRKREAKAEREDVENAIKAQPKPLHRDIEQFCRDRSKQFSFSCQIST